MKRKTVCKILVLTLLLCSIFPCTVGYAATDKNGISPSEAKNAVVRIAAVFNNGEDIRTGSAFGVGELGSEPQHFITNAHVCLDEDSGKLAERIFILLDNRAIRVYENVLGEYYWEIDRAKVVECEVVNRQNISRYPDVAVLKASVPISGRSCLPLLAKEGDLPDASTVYALGYPGNSDYLTVTAGKLEASYSILATANDVNITSGIVSMKTISETYGNSKVIVHTATISSGNSGGPLIDENGTVVGINTYIHGESDANQNVSISIDYVFDILDNNNIPYVLAGQKANVNLKTILLLCIMAVIIATATVLVLRFRKKADEFVDSHALRLQSVCGAYENRRFPLEDGKQISLGRAPDNTLNYPTDTEGVSAHHCLISRKGNQIYLTDCDSSCGTFVNDSVRLKPNETVSIKVGDKISLGSDKQSFIITRKGGKL